MVSTHQKALFRALAGMDATARRELPWKEAAVWMCSCRESQSLSLVPRARSEGSCVRREQGDGVLSLLAEIREEVERLRSGRKAEQLVGWWSQAVPSLRQREEQPAGKAEDGGSL